MDVLTQAGAKMIGVDLSPKMIEVAQANDQTSACEYRVDSVTTLQTVSDATVDLIISNYVIQVSRLPMSRQAVTI